MNVKEIIFGDQAGAAQSIAPSSIQILCLSQPVDVEQYIRRMDDYMAHEEDPQCRACIADNIRQVQDMIQDGAFTTRFFIAYQYEPYMAPGADKDVKWSDIIKPHT